MTSLMPYVTLYNFNITQRNKISYNFLTFIPGNNFSFVRFIEHKFQRFKTELTLKSQQDCVYFLTGIIKDESKISMNLHFFVYFKFFDLLWVISSYSAEFNSYTIAGRIGCVKISHNISCQKLVFSSCTILVKLSSFVCIREQLVILQVTYALM